MGNINDIYSGASLGHADLKGQPHKLTITGVSTKKFSEDDGYEREKIVLSFKETQKTLILNKINATTIAAKYDGDFDRWVGGEITVKPAKAEMKGKLVDCIRVEPEEFVGPVGAEAAAAAVGDNIPF